MRSFAALNKANALFGISIARFFSCELCSQEKNILNVFIEKEYEKRQDT